MKKAHFLEAKDELDQKDLKVIVEELEKIENQKQNKEHHSLTFTKPKITQVGVTTAEAFKSNLNFYDAKSVPLEKEKKLPSKKFEVEEMSQDKDRVKTLFMDEVDLTLDKIMSKLFRQRNKMLSLGLMNEDILNLKLSVQKEIEMKKL